MYSIIEFNNNGPVQTEEYTKDFSHPNIGWDLK